MEKPYNNLPLLAPNIDHLLVDIDIIKKVLSTNKALAKLNWIESMNDRKISSIFLNSLVLTESIWSNDIENINTDIDKVSISNTIDNAIWNEKETILYKDVLLLWMDLLEKRKGIISINDIVKIQEKLEWNKWGIRKTPGTCLKDSKWNIVYYPPEPHFLSEKLNNLEQYINDDTMHNAGDCIKSAIIHHQFESIHPFLDWNWRTWRILILLFLIKQDLINYPILFLSWYINENKWDYYRLLDEVRTKDNWKWYILYMLDAIEQQSVVTSNKIIEINKLYKIKKTAIFEELKMEKKDILVDLLFQEIYISFWELLKNLDVSKPTLIKKLAELEKKWIIQKIKKWKNTLYFFEDYLKVLKK